jgi:hypothetical protein
VKILKPVEEKANLQDPSDFCGLKRELVKKIIWEVTPCRLIDPYKRVLPCSGYKNKAGMKRSNNTTFVVGPIPFSVSEECIL